MLMKKLLYISGVILFAGLMFSDRTISFRNTDCLSPASILKENKEDLFSPQIMSRREMAEHVLISPQVKVHTSQYHGFSDTPVSTIGAANCNALIFVNKADKTWSLWHFPLSFVQGEIDKYMLGMRINQYALPTLPFAFNSLINDINPEMKSNKDYALYIFGGGLNSEKEQKKTNKELATFFTGIGISEIYDMTPQEEHGRGPILDQVIIAKGKDFNSENKQPIVMKYFYGQETLEAKSNSFIVTPRLIGGTKLLQTIKNNKKVFKKSA